MKRGQTPLLTVPGFPQRASQIQRQALRSRSDADPSGGARKDGHGIRSFVYGGGVNG